MPNKWQYLTWIEELSSNENLQNYIVIPRLPDNPENNFMQVHPSIFLSFRMEKFLSVTYALSEISFFNNVGSLKFKNFPFWGNYFDALRGITKQVNSLPDSNFKKLATMLCNYKIIRKQNN